MKTLFLSLMLCGSACAGPFFFGQQGAVSASEEPAAEFDPDSYGLTALRWYSTRTETGYGNGDSVGTMTDGGSASDNATQATSTAKPTWTSSVSGVPHPVLAFDGGDNLRTSSFTLAQPFTLVFVAKSTTTAANNTAIGSVSGFVGVAARTTGQWLQYSGGSLVYAGTSTDWTVIVAVFDGASSFVYANGTKSTGSPGAVGISGGMDLGAWNGGERFVGYGGEWILYSGAMTDGNAAALCSDLQTAWGL